MGRTSRQKFADRERHPQHQSLFDEMDRELRRNRRRVVWPYIIAGAIILLALMIPAILGGIAYASWVLGGFGY